MPQNGRGGKSPRRFVGMCQVPVAGIRKNMLRITAYILPRCFVYIRVGLEAFESVDDSRADRVLPSPYPFFALVPGKIIPGSNLPHHIRFDFR